MHVLTIDTSTIVASAAITSDEKLVAEVIINYKKKHSEKLLPAIHHLMADAGLTISEMDGFGVVKGPGSFTGLRIGMATVKGFAQALNKPVAGISTLEALAANLLYTKGLICPMLDARRGQVFTGIYRCCGDDLSTVMEDSVISVDELIDKLRSFGKDCPIYLLGEAAPLYAQVIQNEIFNAYTVAPHLSMNRASSAGYLAQKRLSAGLGEDYKTLEPFYIRPSYAEE